MYFWESKNGPSFGDILRNACSRILSLGIRTDTLSPSSSVVETALYRQGATAPFFEFPFSVSWHLWYCLPLFHSSWLSTAVTTSPSCPRNKSCHTLSSQRAVNTVFCSVWGSVNPPHQSQLHTVRVFTEFSKGDLRRNTGCIRARKTRSNINKPYITPKLLKDLGLNILFNRTFFITIRLIRESSQSASS